MNPNSNINDDADILSEDFNISDLPPYRRGASYNNADGNEGIGDKYDIFPRMLASESQFYPKHYR